MVSQVRKDLLDLMARRVLLARKVLLARWDRRVLWVRWVLVARRVSVESAENVVLMVPKVLLECLDLPGRLVVTDVMLC